MRFTRRRFEVQNVKLLSIIALLVPLSLATDARSQALEDLALPTPLPENTVLVIGFMGGRDSWDDVRVGVGEFAARLRQKQLPGVHVLTVENRRREVALQLVRRAFDRDRDGRLDQREAASARIILYGQSFGGAAAARFARQLKKIGMPVLLSVQIDSIGLNDETVPANVRSAANLFQRDGYLIRGPRRIRAEDPGATTILGNFQYRYRRSPIDISHLPWYKTIFRKAHARMDRDPEVWRKVEELILAALRGANSGDPRNGVGQLVDDLLGVPRRGDARRAAHGGSTGGTVPAGAPPHRDQTPVRRSAAVPHKSGESWSQTGARSFPHTLGPLPR